MSHAIMVAPALPRVPPVSLAANRKRRQRPPAKTPNKDQNQNLPQNPALGFGIKKKNPVWQCVQNCGACCKLDKGFAFPYPEEIFEDPSDIEIVHISVEWSPEFSRNCMELTRKSSKRKLADTIKAVYGLRSKELDKFNRAIWSTSSQ